LSGDDLFVANGNDGTVGQYDAKTGNVINATFITGLASPSPCGLGRLGNSLFVTDTVGNVLGKYSAKTGKSSGTVAVTYPYGIAFSGNKLFVGAKKEDGDGFTIAEYDAKTVKVIKADFITGLSYPWQIAVLGDKLFVTDGGAGTVGEYDAKTGKVINGAFISGLADPFGIVVKAQSK
jgi:WD40 repeat protein